MLDLVLWSFVMAVTPLVLALAWRLGGTVGNVVQQGHTHGTLRSPAGRRASDVRSVQFHTPSKPRRVARGERWW